MDKSVSQLFFQKSQTVHSRDQSQLRNEKHITIGAERTCYRGWNLKSNLLVTFANSLFQQLVQIFI